MSYSPRKCRNDRAASAGMTLIEVVLALALLGLVSTGLLAVTGNGVRAWLDSREALRQDRRLSNASIRLHETISGMVPMPAIPRSGSFDSVPFFQGERHAMRFVSVHSPTRGIRAGMRLVSLHARPYEGGLRLVVTETACPGPRGLGSLLAGVAEGRTDLQAFRRMPDWEAVESWAVAENLTACQFSYLQGARTASEAAEWVQHWPDRLALPRAVRIEWTDGNRRHGSSLLGGRSITAAVLAEPEPAGRLSGW